MGRTPVAPGVLAWVGIVCALAVPLAAGNVVAGSATTWERAVVAAFVLLATVAFLVASELASTGPIDVSVTTLAAWRVPPYSVPPLDDVPGALKDAALIGVYGVFLVALGASRLDLAGDAVSAEDVAQDQVAAVLAWLVALGVLAYAAAWPGRLRRVAGRPPVARDLVMWANRDRSLVFVAPLGATRRSEVVGIPVRRRVAPDVPLAGTFQVHGVLRPWRVAVIRMPDGRALWPRGGGQGPLRTGLRRLY